MYYIEHKDLDEDTYQIASIQPKTQEMFRDTYQYHSEDKLDVDNYNFDDYKEMN